MSLTPLEYTRLLIGDSEEPYILDDNTISSVLEANNNDPEAASAPLRTMMLMQLAKASGREREGQVEVDSSNVPKNYLQVMDNLKVDKNNAAPIIGGVRKSKFYANIDDPDAMHGGTAIGMFTANTLGFYSELE